MQFGSLKTMLFHPSHLLAACMVLCLAAKAVPAQPSLRKSGPGTAKSNSTQGPEAKTLLSDRPAIVIAGLCDHKARTASSACKTVITRGQFEAMIAAIQPAMSKRARREFALNYADALVMERKAEQLGLNRGANYEEQMKLARIEVLNRALKKEVEERASQITEEEILAYYRDNKAIFEKAEVDRLYIPGGSHRQAVSGSGTNNAGQQEDTKELEERVRGEADTLHARAVAGVEFASLQAEAYRNAGILSAVPATEMWIRSISLPANERLVMDLQSGDVSPVLKDPNGYMIYRMVHKELLPLDQVRDQIKEALRSRKVQDEMQAIMSSSTTTLDDAYFTR